MARSYEVKDVPAPGTTTSLTPKVKDKSGKDDVSHPVDQYQLVMAHNKLPAALLGGTKAMREAGKDFLPQEAKETDTAYLNRLARSTLFNGYSRAVSFLAGQTFSKSVTKGDNFPEALEPILADVDTRGNTLDVFAKTIFQDALGQVGGYILVDMPPLPKDEEGNEVRPTTVAEEKEAGRRPYMVRVLPHQIIGWRTDDRGQLSQIRILEAKQEPDGVFGVVEINQIRVLEPGAWSIWRETKVGNKTTWSQTDQGTTSLEYIPLFPLVLGEELTDLAGRPPLENLADLNLAHWQSASDQTHILHVARVPLLFGRMLDLNSVEVGVSRLINSDDPNGDLKFVEISGKAVEAGQRDLTELENKMALFGLQQLVPRTGSVTATEKALSTAESDSSLKSWTVALDDTVSGALACMAEFMSQDVEKEGLVSFNKDFSLGMLAGFNITEMVKAIDAKILSREMVFNEMKRRGVIMEDMDWDTVKDQLDGEEALAGTAGLGFGNLFGGGGFGNQGGQGRPAGSNPPPAVPPAV